MAGSVKINLKVAVYSTNFICHSISKRKIYFDINTLRKVSIRYGSPAGKWDFNEGHIIEQQLTRWQIAVVTKD